MNTLLANPARRRLFVAAAAGIGVSFVAGCSLPVIPKRPAPDLVDAVGWVRFADGRYRLWLPRVEMGQNIATAMKQIACEELDIEWNQLDLALPATADIRRVRATVGSESVKDYALPLARACATLREALAAGHTSGELQAREWPADELRSLNGRGRRHVGRTPRLEQAEAIVRGLPLYAADVRRPGQLYGRVLRAPASPELPSRLAAADETAARAVAGFVALVRDERLLHGNAQGLGIVARTPGTLDRIETALAARWQVDGTFEQAQIDDAIDIDRRLAASPRRAKQLHDETIDADAPWDVDLRIDIPLAAHAAIEPRAAVAELHADGRLEMWVGSQDVFYQRDVVAKRLGLAEDAVTVHSQRVGGAFGGKTICTVELEAALLARVVAAPVKVQWTRAQEFRDAFHRPPSSHRIRTRLQGGRLGDWWHAFASSHIIFTSAGFPPWMQRLADFVGDPGVARGAELPYRAGARRIGFDAVRLPVHTGPWRGLGAGPNVYAIECAIDECARAAGADALAFRLAHIDDARLARVLRRAGDLAGWPQRTASDAATLRGRGVACGIYKSMSYAAVVADVEVDVVRAAVRVTRLWCAHDCGRVINPDQVRAQCEGNLVWGLGMVLVEQLPVAGSGVSATTFADAPIPRQGDVPSMHIELVDDGAPPTGAGETAIVAAGAAIANALRDACGLRLQRLPLHEADLRAALMRRQMPS
jgi:isoquinoline 1-oxidoreductase beta subunit